jgi:hypothetical protein
MRVGEMNDQYESHHGRRIGAVGRSWGIIFFSVRFPRGPGVPIGWIFSELGRTKTPAYVNGRTAVAGEDGSLSEES